MNTQDLLKCCEQLDTVATNFAAVPENPKAVEVALLCRVAQNYIVELAYHLAEGMEPFDAVEATAKGTLEFTPSAALVMQILAAKTKQ